ncbi:tetratricopeptide repeat protein 17 [Trichogramma pretiosum]|uniref:tetratricopeptide repeat protein 17 n=1 Tax=Trichogramma pretiosum TaxID=7493 RepID=UPI0006C96827|nr:tetratricopeptide repeat protein 17 [Trichogramma pretiosum]
MHRFMQFSILLMVFFENIINVPGSSHWVVTDDGLIRSMGISKFQRNRESYDLITFLDQANKQDSVNELLRTMKERKAMIHKLFRGLHSASEVENGLHKTDHDCKMTEKYDVDLDMHQSIVMDGGFRDGIKSEDFGLEEMPIDRKTMDPNCTETFPLNFHMLTFEHLQGMRDRRELTQKPEKSLMKYIPPFMELEDLGSKIAHGLKQNKTSWLHLNLASIYWRIKGDAYNAIECARRAVVKAPRLYRDIPLLSVGGILHATNYSTDAVTVLNTAIDYKPTESLHHLALANVYAHLGEYNKSIECYDNALKLNPRLDVARGAKHQIRCNLKLENLLSALHQQLLDILAELRAYHSEQTELLSFQEKILWEDLKQMPFLTTPEGILDDEFDSLLSTRGQSCMQRGEDQSILSCDVVSERQVFAQKLQMDLQVLKNFENRAKEIRERMTKSKTSEDIYEHLIQLPDYSKVSSVFMDPTDRPKYHNLEIKRSVHEFEQTNWPKNSLCENMMPFTDVKQYIPVYLPPENKGFVTYLFVNELIGMSSVKEHPLPWYPPICKGSKPFNPKYIPAELIKATMGYNNLPDSSLAPHLTALVENSELSEIGQRILTATNSKVAAPWVLSMLASLYWRIVGKPRNALDCLQLALDTVPDKFKDVPLVSVASISHKFSLIDNALSAAQEAYKTNPVEPMTNFMYGTLLHLKGNYSGAIYHLKQTLRVEPDAMDGRALTILQTIACQQRLIQIKTGSKSDDTATWCIGITDLPDKFETHHTRLDESILCDNDGRNCKRVQCFAVQIDPDTLLPDV